MTQARATEVGPDTISIYNKTTKSTTKYPQGVVVWATGVSPGPLIRSLMARLP